MTPTLRTLPTAYDPADGAATVATPSCCCCCCCCLVTVGGVVGFTVAEIVYRADEDPAPTHGRRVAAVALALAAVPAAVLVALGAARWQVSDDSVALITIATYLLVTTLGFALAGVRLARALGMATVVGAIGAVALVIEVPLALVTFFVLEVAAPGGVAIGCVIARGRHRTRIANNPAARPRPRPGTPLPPPW